MFSSPFTFGRRELKLSEAKYAFLGIPYDSSESYRVGSRLAPNAIRESSREIEDYDFLDDFDLLSIKLCDLGDVDVSFGNFGETLMRVKDCVREILKNSAIPVCVGGEHTISYCVLSAYEKKPFFLAFDAHLDFRKEYLNEKFSHACVVRRVGELIGYENILVVGVRSADREELRDAKKLGLKFIDFKGCDDKLAGKITKLVRGKEVYLSVDMDVFDPREARGVCNPEPLGISYPQFVDCLGFLRQTKLVGFDLVEVAPLYDSYTQILAAKLIFKTLLKNEMKKMRG